MRGACLKHCRGGALLPVCPAVPQIEATQSEASSKQLALATLQQQLEAAGSRESNLSEELATMQVRGGKRKRVLAAARTIGQAVVEVGDIETCGAAGICAHTNTDAAWSQRPSAR